MYRQALIFFFFRSGNRLKRSIARISGTPIKDGGFRRVLDRVKTIGTRKFEIPTRTFHSIIPVTVVETRHETGIRRHFRIDRPSDRGIRVATIAEPTTSKMIEKTYVFYAVLFADNYELATYNECCHENSKLDQIARIITRTIN